MTRGDNDVSLRSTLIIILSINNTTHKVKAEEKLTNECETFFVSLVFTVFTYENA